MLLAGSWLINTSNFVDTEDPIFNTPLISMELLNFQITSLTLFTSLIILPVVLVISVLSKGNRCFP